SDVTRPTHLAGSAGAPDELRRSSLLLHPGERPAPRNQCALGLSPPLPRSPPCGNCRVGAVTPRPFRTTSRTATYKISAVAPTPPAPVIVPLIRPSRNRA